MPTFPLAKFRALFPQYDEVPDDTVEAQAEMAWCFAQGRGCSCSSQMWLLLTAHLLAVAANMADNGGAVAGVVTSTSIGKISVSFAAPPAGSDWSYWLQLSPYGQQFLALYQVCSSAPAYVGGRQERAGFRVVGGVFPGRRW